MVSIHIQTNIESINNSFIQPFFSYIKTQFFLSISKMRTKSKKKQGKSLDIHAHIRYLIYIEWSISDMAIIIIIVRFYVYVCVRESYILMVFVLVVQMKIFPNEMLLNDHIYFHINIRINVKGLDNNLDKHFPKNNFRKWKFI